MASLQEQWLEIKQKYGGVFIAIFEYCQKGWEWASPYFKDGWTYLKTLPLVVKIRELVVQHYALIDEKYKKLGLAAWKLFYKLALVAIVGWAYVLFISAPSLIINFKLERFYELANRLEFVLAQESAGMVAFSRTPKGLEAFVTSELELANITASVVMPENAEMFTLTVNFPSMDFGQFMKFAISLHNKGVAVVGLRADKALGSYSLILAY